MLDFSRLILTSWPALKALRNQLTIKHDETSISAGDERLQLLRGWLSSTLGAGAQELFEIWESANPVRSTAFAFPHCTKIH